MIMKLSNAQFYFFDMDGLIFDTETVAARLMMQRSFQLGFHLPLTLFHRAAGCNYRKIVQLVRKTVGTDCPYPKIWQETQHALRSLSETAQIPLKPGAADLIRFLAKHGKTLWLVTSSPTETARRLLDGAGLLSAFSGFVSGDSVPRSKPHPDIYLNALRQAAAEPARSFAFEDSVNGAKAAVAAKIPTVIVPDRVQIPPSLQKKAFRVLPSLTDFLTAYQQEVSPSR